MAAGHVRGQLKWLGAQTAFSRKRGAVFRSLYLGGIDGIVAWF